MGYNQFLYFSYLINKEEISKGTLSLVLYLPLISNFEPPGSIFSIFVEPSHITPETIP